MEDQGRPRDPVTNPLRKRKPTIAFVLSLLGGLLILGVAVARIIVMLFAFTSVLPGIIDPAYEMLTGQFPAGGPLPYVEASVVAVSGAFVLAGAILIHHRPAKASTWGYVILAFSFVSFIGTGGLLVGAILGILGGAYTILLIPDPPKTVPPTETISGART
jgi:hypothetical protein